MKTLDKVVGISVGLFVAAILLPMALNEMANATMTNVDATVVTIVQVLLPIMAVIGIAVYFIYAD